MMAGTMRVEAKDLRVGDFIAGTNVMVDAVYVESDGNVWVEYSDGDEGYVTPSRKFVIET